MLATRGGLALLMLLCVFATGCVRRRLTVRTNPAGASVYVDKQLIGNSPASTAYTYYGTREIEVVADGFRTEKVLREFKPPWYQIPPLDFISETLWPRELRDERVIDIAMVPSQPMAKEVLQSRGDQLRQQASQGTATPLPPTIDSGAGFVPGRPQSGYDPLGNVPPKPATTAPPMWQPGQLLQDFVQPGGIPATRIPEAGILPGGGYRPELP